MAMTAVVTDNYSGNPNFDGLLSGYQWGNTRLTFSFPTDPSDYSFGYIPGYGANTNDFAPLNQGEQQAALAVFADYSAISNLQFTQITETANQQADLREAQSGLPDGAMTCAPNLSFNQYPESADSWYNNGTTTWGNLIQNPVVGGYGFYAFLHEIGIALGMNDDVQGTDLPASEDSMAYSVESYRSYVGAPVTGLSNATWSYAQTPMVDDIAAIQQMYGANFSGVGRTAVYSWNPNTGEESINGVGQGTPGGNTIFMTVWDQGATATYDLSSYSTNLTIDLRPGAWSTFSTAQLAVLGADSSGNPILAPGNVANALEYDNNPASLVTSVIGGSGHNTIIGNDAGDYIFGGTGGGNIIQGGSGDNTIDGGPGGNNTIVFTGDYSNYQVTPESNGAVQIVDLRPGSPDGTDQITNIENFQFDNGTYDLNQLLRGNFYGGLINKTGLAAYGLTQIGGDAGTPAEMLARAADTGMFEGYTISNGSAQVTDMGAVGLGVQVAGFGDFSGIPGETDMLMRDSNTGMFEVYNIGNGQFISASEMGAVGLDLQVVGIGDFSGTPGASGMLLQDINNGALEFYDISNNQVTGTGSMGEVGLECQVAGFGDFSSNAGETDMLMRNSNTGAFELYDIVNNQVVSAQALGAVGLDCQVVGFGDFSGNAGETDMIMRNSKTGAFELYDIADNQVVGAYALGAVGLTWQVAGFGSLDGDSGGTSMLLQNINTGAFESYDITNNSIAGTALLTATNATGHQSAHPLS